MAGLSYFKKGNPQKLNKETIDISREVEITMKEAECYGIELSKPNEVRTAIERLADLGVPGRITLSIPPDVCSCDEMIAASNRLNVSGDAFISSGILGDLADRSNRRQVLGIRLLPYARNDDGMEKIGHYYDMHQKDQLKIFRRDKERFASDHVNFGIELATVQEVISVFNRHIISGGDSVNGQVYADGWYRTDIVVPGGLAFPRRLCVCSGVGRLRLYWSDVLIAVPGYSLALSAGEIEI